MHFASNQKQATLHTGVLSVGGTEDPLCFCTISASKEKGPHAIWVHLSPILDEVKKTHPSVEVVHFFSDGPTTQYRQKGNFFLFSTELLNRGFKRGTWNFFEASHGKGAPDGVGGLLKRTADRLVSHGHDIPTAEHLYHALANRTAVKLFYIQESLVDDAAKMMPILPAVPSTMRIHQVVTGALGEILYRDVSAILEIHSLWESSARVRAANVLQQLPQLASPDDIPQFAFTKTELREGQLRDPVLSRVLYFVERSCRPFRREKSKEPVMVIRYFKHCEKLMTCSGVAVSKDQVSEMKRLQFVVPDSFKYEVLKGIHDSAGRQGQVRSLGLARQRLLYHTDRDVKENVNQCSRCVISKMTDPEVRAPL
ncbi:hypothetical protein ACEWY4_020566 [Coilia grayii]|uniref:Integrase zinc-binding domain-containing protein n=1 Tax=Coilia grayii TaxID=363190 RepID=A0ABD1JD20_9TELE